MKRILFLLCLLVSGITYGQFQTPPNLWMYDNAEQMPEYEWDINFQVGYAMATGGTQNPPNQDPRARVTVSSAYARKGTYSYQMHLEKRFDYPCGGKGCEWVRSEWMWMSPSQQTASNIWNWASVSTLVAPTVQFENRPFLFAFDTKSSPDNYQTPFGLTIENGNYVVGFYVGQGQENGKYIIGPVIKGVWEDWVINRNFEDNNTGYIYLYRNGSLVWSRVGLPNYRRNSGDAPIPRIQHGIYKWVWSDAGGNGWGEGVPLSAANAPIDIYYDEIRFGKSTATLADMLVDGGTGNSVPTANAGPDKFITLPATTAALQGSGTDSDGSIISYGWTQSPNNPVQANIASPASAITGITGLTVAGTYGFTLTVIDNNGASAIDQVQVTVNPVTPAPNNPPSAFAGQDQIITLPDTSYTFITTGPNAARATDPDGGTLSVLWSVIYGSATLVNPNSIGATVNGLTSPGYYTLRLTVTDPVGLTATDTMNITVRPEPVAPKPVAVVGINQTIILPLDSVFITGSQSSMTSPDSIDTYEWSKLSGPAGFSLRDASNPLTVAYDLEEGTYVIRLIVTASNTEKDTADMTVVVLPAPISNLPPEIDSMSLVVVNLPTVTATGSAYVNVSATDSDGSITSYAWTQVSGPTRAIFVNNSAASTYINDLLTGTYVFMVTVYDDKQLSSTATVTVYVRQPLRRGIYPFIRFRKRTT